MEYDGIPFHFHRCHQYGHLEKQFHINFKISLKKLRKISIEPKDKILYKDGSQDKTRFVPGSTTMQQESLPLPQH